MPHNGAEEPAPQPVPGEVEGLVVGPQVQGVEGGDGRGQEGAGQHLRGGALPALLVVLLEARLDLGAELGERGAALVEEDEERAWCCVHVFFFVFW